MARLAGVPVFLWLVLGPQADGWAVALLIVAGLSDWLDGVIARAWNQQSRLGQVLDPTADRLYIAATLIGLALNLGGVSIVKALYWCAILNGFIAPPLMVMILRISGNREIMGRRANGPLLALAGWITTAVMFAAAAGTVLL